MELFGANPVDVVVLVIVIVSGLLALVRGFVAEVLSMLGFVAAIFASLYGLPHVEPKFAEYFTSPLIARGIASASLFFGTLAVTSAFSYFISRQMRGTHLSAIDRSLGFLFGLVRGAILVCLLYICVSFVFPVKKDTQDEGNSMQKVLREARTGPALESGAHILMSFAPNHGIALDSLTGSSSSLNELVKPQIQRNESKSDDNRGYKDPARKDLNHMIDSTGANQ